MNKLVSVIIPTFSRPMTIKRAICSVINQTYSPIEIIVVDDNGDGTDNQIETEKMLSSFISDKSINYIKHKINKNAQYARNTGIRHAKGRYITILDDDDEMLPNKIEQQVLAIESTLEEFKASYCGCKIYKNGKLLSKKKTTGSGNFQKELLMLDWGMGTGSNPLFKREVFDDIGLYDVSFKRRQDIEFMVRYFRKYKIVEVKDYGIIKHNDSKPKRPDPKGYIKITEHFLQTFSVDIDSYGYDVSCSIRHAHYFANCLLAFDYHDYITGWILYLKCLKYKRYSIFKDILRIVKHILYRTGKR